MRAALINAFGEPTEVLELSDEPGPSMNDLNVIQSALPSVDEPRRLAMLGINPPTASLLLDEAPDLKPGDWVVQNADLVERTVFIHDHEITADGLQLGDELRATHEIDPGSSRKRSRAARHRQTRAFAVVA
jgi:hypothetical protein